MLKKKVVTSKVKKTKTEEMSDAEINAMIRVEIRAAHGGGPFTISFRDTTEEQCC